LFFAWAFELTTDGVKRESEVDRSQSIAHQTGHKLDRSIIFVLVVALAWFGWDRFSSSPSSTAQVESESIAVTEVPYDQPPSAKSIAVLPFIALSSGLDDEYFADGLTEEILNSLAQLPELLVTARTSSFHFKGQDINVQEIASALGVNHIVEGSVRRSGERLRVTAQLIRAEDGFHVWSENYDSTSEDAISVQEDIAEKIAKAMDVVMNDEKRAAMRQVGLRDVEAFIAYQKADEISDRAHGDIDILTELQRSNEYLDIVIDRVPEFATAYVFRSDLYFHILLADATGQSLAGITEEVRTSAFQNAENDLAAAAHYARTTAERYNAELDLAFLNGHWQGISGRIEKILNGDDCAQSNWLDSIATVYGYAEQLLVRQSEYRACDPLLSTMWFNAVRTQMWAGDVTGAIDLARQGDQVAPGSWLDQALIVALVADKNFAEAEKLISNRLQSGDIATFHNLMLAAAGNDRPRAAELLVKMLQLPERDGFQEIIAHAWTGDRESANRMAGTIDRHPAGPMSLTLITAWCACGAPWELSATPNFASKLEEANLPWPPASHIEFPMKDW